jgi:beta-glucosidase
MNAAHHVNMAHGVAVKACRAAGLSAPIGISWNPTTPRPATARAEDKRAAEIARIIETEVFMFPCLGKGYPNLSACGISASFPVEAGDLDAIAQPMDFIGINFYNEQPVCADERATFKFRAQPFWQEVTEMGWPVTPGGLARQLSWIAETSKGVFGRENIPIFITENGCACPDEVGADGRVHDTPRINYLRKHLAVCADLVKSGLNLKGYYAWSMLDNFEWTFGYSKRFGIIHVDYATQKRTPKDSAYFLRDVIAGYGE